jgi:CheY-like chemotaxis protein
VLVVDDEETVPETLSLQLGRERRALTASDGEKALRVPAGEGTAAAVISDMRMRPYRACCQPTAYAGHR